MPLIPYHPFRGLESWFDQEWDELWDWHDRWLPKLPLKPLVRTPRADVYETDGQVVAEVEVPGVNRKDIDVEIEEDTIKVEVKAEEKKEKKGKGYYTKELRRGYVRRVLPLPVNVNEKKAKAVYKDGVLKITVPKVKPKEKKEKKTKVEVG